MTKLLSLSAKIWFQRAKALNKLKLYDDALDSVEKSLGILKPSEEEFNEAQSLQATLIQQVVDKHINEGFWLALNQDYQGAIAKYNRAIQLNPNLAKVYFFRGSSRFSLKDIEGAIKDWNKSLTLDPKYASSYNSLAIAYNDYLEDYQKALEYINEAIRLEPDNSLFYSKRAHTRFNLKDYQRAINDCNQALEIMSENSDAYYMRGRIYEAIEDYQAAIEDYSRSLRIDPQQHIVLMERGSVFITTHNYQNAIEDYTQVTKLEPKSAEGYMCLGVAWIALEDQKQELANYQEALNSFHQAIKLFSEQGDRKEINKVKLLIKEVEKYSKLRSLLMAKKWEEADNETAKVIIDADVLNIPSEDLRIIDNLWVSFSNGHFGFSVQQKIWNTIKKNVKAQENDAGANVVAYKALYGFGEYVGWWDGRWLNWSELTYEGDAFPVGHLPSGKFRNSVGAGSWYKWEEFFNLVERYGLLDSEK